VDSAFSLEPDELKQLVIETERAAHSLGKISYGPTEAEKKSLQYRRSLYLCNDVKKGDVLTPVTLKSIRPGFGLSCKYYDQLIGKTVNQDFPKGTPMNWDYIV
jgi:sialic acid synthase SpsE